MNLQLPSLSGVWHLLGEFQDENPLPSHRMDLRIDHRPGHLRAAVLSRNTGEEMPLIHSVSLDAGVLMLQMVAAAGQPQEAMPWLTMRENAGRLAGHWELQGTPVGPKMKLVRAAD